MQEDICILQLDALGNFSYVRDLYLITLFISCQAIIKIGFTMFSALDHKMLWPVY